jgi:RNA polymerase sigma-54 factor
MKQSLQLRTSQHLALTPQLQQSIRLLQLSTLELHQELEQLLTENPLLERLDDPLDHSVRLLADGAIGQASPAATAAEGPVNENTPPADAAPAEPEQYEGDSNTEGGDSDWSDESGRTRGVPRRLTTRTRARSWKPTTRACAST